jgi:hypothetical protein
VVVGWHYPSDVLGGYLIATFVREHTTALAVAAGVAAAALALPAALASPVPRG